MSGQQDYEEEMRLPSAGGTGDRGMLKGAVAGTSPTGPWTDGRTGARTPADDERHPWRIPLDRLCLLRYLMQSTFKPYMTLSRGGGGGCAMLTAHCSLVHAP